MKVKIKDLRPNPFRDSEHYPIDQEKVESLKRSINKTGFWDNILARKTNGTIEIAYGHHRLEALKQIYKLDDQVDIPIKDISDDDMLRIMLLENDEEYDSRPVPFNEGIKQAWEWLKRSSMLGRMTRLNKTFLCFENLPIPKPGETKENILSWQIANWIAPNYSEIKVGIALETLKSTGQIEIDEKGTKEEKVAKKAAEKMPTKTSQSRLVKTIKKTSLKPQEQERVADRITQEGDFSEKGIRRAILEEVHRKEPKKKSQKELKLFELREEIKETSLLTEKLNSKLLTLTKFKNEIQDEVYENEIKALAIDINLLMQRLKTFLGGKNVKQLKG